MSLIPVKSFPGAVPVIFIEARLQGPPRIAFAQLGLSFDVEQCNVGMLTRTSGALLFASVGSYMVYRICARLFGRGFIWAILDQTKVDMLARSDARLLHSDFDFTYDDSDESEMADDELSPTCSYRYSNRTPGSRLSSRTSQLNQLRRSCCTVKRRLRITDDADTSHRDTACANDVCKDRKDTAVVISSSAGSIQSSDLTRSRKSASLRLVWDDPQWDEQADIAPYASETCRSASPSATNVSDMSVFREADNLFSDGTAPKSDFKKKSFEDFELKSMLGETSDSVAEAHEFIQKNCMNDSQHLYRITGYITTTTATSDGMSLSSEPSTRSLLSLKQKLIAQEALCGLLDLAQSDCLPSPSGQTAVSMTDSGISKGTASTSNFMSNHRRTNLNFINEDFCSPSTSTHSSEWFEDDYCSFNTSERTVQYYLSEYFHADGSSDNQVPVKSDEAQKRHLLRYSRDLIAWSRERFTNDRHQMKVQQMLYTKYCWRRIGLKRSSKFSDHFIASLVHAMCIINAPFFVNADVTLLFEAVRKVFLQYEFAKEWQIPEELFSEKEVITKEEIAVKILTVLWDVQNGLRTLNDNDTEKYCMEGIRLLALLWITHLFEEIEEHGNINHFYSRLFGDRNPRQLIKTLRDGPYGTDELWLLADSVRVRVRIVNCAGDVLCGLPQVGLPYEKDTAAVLTFLKPSSTDDFVFPLFHNIL